MGDDEGVVCGTMDSMPGIIFVAPYLLEATLRFVDVTVDLEGVDVVLLTQEPSEKIPERLISRLSGSMRLHDCMDPDEVETAVRKLQAPLGGISRIFGALEQLQVPLAIVRERLGIEGMSVEAAANFRDKARMKTVLQNAGLPCARHQLAGTPTEAVAWASEIGFPLVAKPPAGSGGRDTFRIDDMNRLQQVLAMLPPHPERPLLLEEFMTGIEHSYDAVSIGGKVVWYSVSDYRPTPLEVMENPWIQWCVLLPRDISDLRYQSIREAGASSLDELGMGTGLTHMEWFERPGGGIAISEVAARPPGAQFTTLISYAHDIDLYRAWARLMVFGHFDPPERRYAAGAAYLRGVGTGRVKKVHGLDQAQRELGEIVVEAKLPRPGQPASGSYEGEGYVIVRHPETEVVAEALNRLINLLRVELTEQGVSQ